MAYGVEPDRGTGLVLRRLARPYDPARAVAALLGIPRRAAQHVVGVELATSAEAEALLDAMPHILRSLAIATTDQPVRCYGELRGPVLWSETMSARSASAGDPGLFVCATTTKAYDTQENRVLKGALAAIAAAGRAVEPRAESVDGDHGRRARLNGQRANRQLEHQSLAAVPVTRLTPRSLQRTRAGSRRTTYGPALALLRRAAEPVSAARLTAIADARTRAQHDLFAATLAQLEAVAGPLPPLRTAHGGLVAGPITYHHPGRTLDDHQTDGITVGQVLLDVPDPLGTDPGAALGYLRARAEGRTAVLATGPEDVERAIALATEP